MKNDVPYSDNVHLKAEEETNLISSPPKDDYSTIIEKSLFITETTTKFDLYKGLIFMFFSCVLKSIFSLLCKVVLDRNKTISSYHLLTVKAYFMVSITVCLSIFHYFKQSNSPTSIFQLPRKEMLLITIRSVLSVISISLSIFALTYMSMSDVYAVYYIYPAIVILLSSIFLKEVVETFDYVCLFTCFIGVILIIRPEFLFSEHKDSSMYYMFGLVILSAILKGVEDIIIRNTGKNIFPLAVPFIYSIVAMLLYPITLVMAEKVIPSYTFVDVILIFFIALFSFIYQTLMTMGLQHENAGRVSMVNYFQVIFMFLFDLFIFNKQLIFFDAIGTVMIFSFNFLNGMLKANKRNEELNQHKAKLNNNK